MCSQAKTTTKTANQWKNSRKKKDSKYISKLLKYRKTGEKGNEEKWHHSPTNNRYTEFSRATRSSHKHSHSRGENENENVVGQRG